jgi:thiol-disulfide isomerase/thioredoxin
MLKKLPILMFLLCFPALTVGGQDTKIEWHKDFKKAQELARSTGKPMLLDFVADWCEPCKEMGRTFWPKPEIVELSKKFVCVSMAYDDRGPEISRYRVNSIPAVVFTDPWGNLLTARFGFGPRSAAPLTQIIHAVPSDFSPIDEWNALLAREKDNPIALTKIGGFYREHNILDISTSFFKLALKTKEMDADLKGREDLLIAIGVNYLKAKDYDDAQKAFETALKEVANGAQADKALLGILTALLNKKKLNEGEKTLARLKTTCPNSPLIVQGEKLLQQVRSQKN